MNAIIRPPATTPVHSRRDIAAASFAAIGFAPARTALPVQREV